MKKNTALLSLVVFPGDKRKPASSELMEIGSDAEISSKDGPKGHIVDESYGTSYIARADAYMMIRKHDDAIAEINKAVSIQPGDAFPHLWLGWYLHWAGRGEEAIDAVNNHP